MRILKVQEKVMEAAVALLAGVLSSLPALADPTISASANPVPIPDGQTSATATIT